MRNTSSVDRSYDPLSALAIRLGTPEGEGFLVENRDFVRETYGEAAETLLCAAVFESDSEKARELVDLLAPGTTISIKSKTNGSCAVDYENIVADIKGVVTTHHHGSAVSSEVAAIISAAASVVSAIRRHELTDSTAPHRP